MSDLFKIWLAIIVGAAWGLSLAMVDAAALKVGRGLGYSQGYLEATRTAKYNSCRFFIPDRTTQKKGPY